MQVYLTAVGLSLESARDKLSFCDFCPRTKSLSGTFDFPNNLQWNDKGWIMYNVGSCKVPCSSVHVVENYNLPRHLSYSIHFLATFPNNSHFSLLIHSSSCVDPGLMMMAVAMLVAKNVYPTRIGAAAQAHISFIFYTYQSSKCRQLTRNVNRSLTPPREIIFFAYFGCLRWNHKKRPFIGRYHQKATQFW